MWKKLAVGAIILSVVVSAILIPNCACEVDVAVNKPEELAPVEIREYQGENLSSINDFLENSIKGPQYIEKEKYRLEVIGLVEKPQSYSYDEVVNDQQHYKKVVTLNCVEGWSVDILWEGVLVKDLLEEAHPTLDAKVVIFHAYDGFTTSLPLDYIMTNNIIMAHKMNDVTLPPERGFPFELVAESKWGYKWIKWITKIEFSDDESYRGFWETRGYSNNGDLDEPFFSR
ncbi:MAG TPA: molybdopterin-dependent oxidoreductase [Dehalococcoidia bacterium]|nr:molybdopterin-dependent oxidoreductase [Dehalococcoidia bacterium]